MSQNINLQQYWAYYMRDDDSLTMENVGTADINVSFVFSKGQSTYYKGNLYYRKYLDWYSMKGAEVVIKPGETVRFRGSLSRYTTAYGGGFSMSGDSYIRLSGKLTSISEGMSNTGSYLKITNNKVTGDAFMCLFEGCEQLKYAQNLSLASNTAPNCYAYMFDHCTSLVSTPEFKNIQLEDGCYAYMFQGCTSLVQAGVYTYDGQEQYYELPSTQLASRCYEYMFKDCSSLQNIPRLPALELKSYCYQFMFAGCTNLTEAPVLPAETLAVGCYMSMFAGCTSLWYAPELHAKILVPDCYCNMFNGCSQIKRIVLLAEDIDRDQFESFVDSKDINGITRYMYHYYVYKGIFGSFIGNPVELPYYNENNDWYTLVIPYNFEYCRLYNLDKRYNTSDEYGWIAAGGTTSNLHYPEWEEIVTYLVPTFAEWYTEAVNERNSKIKNGSVGNSVKDTNSIYGRSFGTTPMWSNKWPTQNDMPGGQWRVIRDTGTEVRGRYKKDIKQV